MLRKFCSEVDEGKDAINELLYAVLLKYSTVNTILISTLFLVAVTSNTDVMEGKKLILVCGKEGRKKNTTRSIYTAYKTGFSYTNAEHNHIP